MRKLKKLASIILAISSLCCVLAITASANEIEYSTWYCYTTGNESYVSARTQITNTDLLMYATVDTTATEVDDNGYIHELSDSDSGTYHYAQVDIYPDTGYQIAKASSHHTVYHYTSNYYGSEDTYM